MAYLSLSRKQEPPCLRAVYGGKSGTPGASFIMGAYSRNVSGQGCVIGVKNSCYYPQTEDTYLAPSFSEIGAGDLACPCPIAYAFARTVPGATYHINTIPDQSGHGAGFGSSASGEACAVNGPGMCADSLAAKNITEWMSTLKVFGNVTNAGAASGGIRKARR